MTGETIHLLTKEKELDSLQIFGNAFIIEKDSINNNRFNQITGSELYGFFENGKLKNLNVIKNTQIIYYLYSDKNELIGINKSVCSELNVFFKKNKISEISFYISPKGDVFPDEKLESNLRELKGFLWREDECPKSFKHLFYK